MSACVSLLAGSSLVNGLDLDLTKPGERPYKPISTNGHFTTFRTLADMCLFRFHQIRSKDRRLQHDDILYREQDRRRAREPTATILLVAGRRHVWDLNRLLLLHG